MTLRSSDRDKTEAEIERIRSLGLDELRARWRATFRSPPPAAFTKDLVARFLCWHIQEQAFGELAADTATLLDSVARGDKPAMDRRLKPGTVLVREYQGERHTVTVVLGGYAWRDTTYTSLSMVARAITGTSWNGHRFFGLETGLIARDPAPPAIGLLRGFGGDGTRCRRPTKKGSRHGKQQD